MSSYPQLKFGHDDSIDMLREMVAAFSAAEIAPRAADIDRDNIRHKNLQIMECKITGLAETASTVPILFFAVQFGR